MLMYTCTTLADWDKLACQEARRCTEQSQRKQMEEREKKTNTRNHTFAYWKSGLTLWHDRSAVGAGQMTISAIFF